MILQHTSSKQFAMCGSLNSEPSDSVHVGYTLPTLLCTELGIDVVQFSVRRSANILFYLFYFIFPYETQDDFRHLQQQRRLDRESELFATSSVLFFVVFSKVRL
jgi:hypothetical protein